MTSYNRIEFRVGTNYEQEMYFKPFFELRKRKLIQVEDEIFPRFYKLSALIKKHDVYISSNLQLYYSVQKFEDEKYKQDLSFGRIWDDILGEVVREEL